MTTVRIELVAPSEIAPGESVQLIMNAIKSDGSVENVSSQAQWTPADSPVLQLSPTGLATGKDRGAQLVSARFSGASAEARIFVVPKGTFRLAGTVQDSDFALENVAVTVISGVGAGLATLSGVDGSYALYGVSGPVQLQLKKEGYLNTVQQVEVTAHRTQDFRLVAERPGKGYDGTYTLTISADEPCRGHMLPDQFPGEAKRRVYTANVTQEDNRLTVTLSGADFIVTNGHGNRFFGAADPAGAITFPIGVAFDWYYSYSGRLDLVERFGSTALVINGTVSARGTPGRISGTLSGSLMIAQSSAFPFDPGDYKPSCYSTAHGFDMVRR